MEITLVEEKWALGRYVSDEQARMEFFDNVAAYEFLIVEKLSELLRQSIKIPDKCVLIDKHICLCLTKVLRECHTADPYDDHLYDRLRAMTIVSPEFLPANTAMRILLPPEDKPDWEKHKEICHELYQRYRKMTVTHCLCPQP